MCTYLNVKRLTADVVVSGEVRRTPTRTIWYDYEGRILQT